MCIRDARNAQTCAPGTGEARTSKSASLDVHVGATSKERVPFRSAAPAAPAAPLGAAGSSTAAAPARLLTSTPVITNLTAAVTRAHTELPTVVIWYAKANDCRQST